MHFQLMRSKVGVGLWVGGGGWGGFTKASKIPGLVSQVNGNQRHSLPRFERIIRQCPRTLDEESKPLVLASITIFFSRQTTTTATPVSSPGD